MDSVSAALTRPAIISPVLEVELNSSFTPPLYIDPSLYSIENPRYDFLRSHNLPSWFMDSYVSASKPTGTLRTFGIPGLTNGSAVYCDQVYMGNGWLVNCNVSNTQFGVFFLPTNRPGRIYQLFSWPGWLNVSDPLHLMEILTPAGGYSGPLVSIYNCWQGPSSCPFNLHDYETTGWIQVYDYLAVSIGFNSYWYGNNTDLVFITSDTNYNFCNYFQRDDCNDGAGTTAHGTYNRWLINFLLPSYGTHHAYSYINKPSYSCAVSAPYYFEYAVLDLF